MALHMLLQAYVVPLILTAPWFGVVLGWVVGLAAVLSAGRRSATPALPGT